MEIFFWCWAFIFQCTYISFFGLQLLSFLRKAHDKCADLFTAKRKSHKMNDNFMNGRISFDCWFFRALRWKKCLTAITKTAVVETRMKKISICIATNTYLVYKQRFGMNVAFFDELEKKIAIVAVWWNPCAAKPSEKTSAMDWILIAFSFQRNFLPMAIPLFIVALHKVFLVDSLFFWMYARLTTEERDSFSTCFSVAREFLLLTVPNQMIHLRKTSVNHQIFNHFLAFFPLWNIE